jgi:hypothetical protein
MDMAPAQDHSLSSLSLSLCLSVRGTSSLDAIDATKRRMRRDRHRKDSSERVSRRTVIRSSVPATMHQCTHREREREATGHMVSIRHRLWHRRVPLSPLCHSVTLSHTHTHTLSLSVRAFIAPVGWAAEGTFQLGPRVLEHGRAQIAVCYPPQQAHIHESRRTSTHTQIHTWTIHSRTHDSLSRTHARTFSLVTSLSRALAHPRV